MAINRRGFLQAGSMAGIAAIIPTVLGKVAFALPKDSNKALARNLANLRRVDFEQQLNTKFRFDTQGSNLTSARSRWIETELITVEDLRTSPGSEDDKKGIEHFSLTFRDSFDDALAQGTYTVKHETLGKFRLFVVPARDSRAGLNYLALFNRLASTG
ncbi:MAG: twin-arginine translocation signal domain-containing protein [Blastocatellia bacterium]